MTFAKKIIPISFFLFICWVIWQANIDADNLLFKLAKNIPFHDKIGHFILYGMLALLMEWAFNFRTIKLLGKKVSMAGLLVLSFAIVEEFTQIWIVSRSFDYLDMLGDVLGIIIFIKIAQLSADNRLRKQS